MKAKEYIASYTTNEKLASDYAEEFNAAIKGVSGGVLLNKVAEFNQKWVAICKKLPLNPDAFIQTVEKSDPTLYAIFLLRKEAGII